MRRGDKREGPTGGSLPNDRDKGKRAVEQVLDTFYRNIGTPAPAPGIERLAFFAVEAAYTSLREAWQEDLLSDESIEAAIRAMGVPYDDWSAGNQAALRAKVRGELRGAIDAMPLLGAAGLPRSAEEPEEPLVDDQGREPWEPRFEDSDGDGGAREAEDA